jgi:transposase
MSLDAIAEQVGKHPSTVSYWLKKHGLEANGAGKHRPRGAIRRADIEPLVREGLPLRVIAERLGRSQRTVRYWIEKHTLPSPIQVRREGTAERVDPDRGAVVRTCAQHGRTSFVVERSGRVRCRLCRQERVTEWRRRLKARLVEEAGGRCELCGYDACIGALHFHHRNPDEKVFALSGGGMARSLARVREEAAKCSLLCANCHAEVEAGVRTVP